MATFFRIIPFTVCGECKFWMTLLLTLCGWIFIANEDEWTLRYIKGKYIQRGLYGQANSETLPSWNDFFRCQGRKTDQGKCPRISRLPEDTFVRVTFFCRPRVVASFFLPIGHPSSTMPRSLLSFDNRHETRTAFLARCRKLNYQVRRNDLIMWEAPWYIGAIWLARFFFSLPSGQEPSISFSGPAAAALADWLHGALTYVLGGSIWLPST